MHKEEPKVLSENSKVFNISNALSIVRALLIIPVAILIWNSLNVWAFVLMVFAALTDYVDGYLARKLNQVTEVGKIIDPLADKIFIGILAIVLLYKEIIPFWYMALVIGRDVAILIGGLIVSSRLKAVPMSNFIGKIAVLSIGITFSIHILGLDLKEVSLVVSSTLIVVSFANYSFRAIKNLKTEEKEGEKLKNF